MENKSIYESLSKIAQKNFIKRIEKQKEIENTFAKGNVKILGIKEPTLDAYKK